MSWSQFQETSALPYFWLPKIQVACATCNTYQLYIDVPCQELSTSWHIIMLDDYVPRASHMLGTSYLLALTVHPTCPDGLWLLTMSQPLGCALPLLSGQSLLFGNPTWTSHAAFRPGAMHIHVPLSSPDNCEGNTETRPLVYRDSLRQGQAKQMWHTDTVVILSSIIYTWERGNREHTWHSGNPQRSSWGVPTVSATI